MAKKESKEKFKTMIGGQALIEGIMMMGPDKSAVVVRTKNGIESKVTSLKKSEGFSVKKLPFIRGVFNFCKSMKVGVQALMYSADLFAEDDEAETPAKQSKFDAWLEKKLSGRKGAGHFGHPVCHSGNLLFRGAVFRAAVPARICHQSLDHVQ